MVHYCYRVVDAFALEHSTAARSAAGLAICNSSAWIRVSVHQRYDQLPLHGVIDCRGYLRMAFDVSSCKLETPKRVLAVTTATRAGQEL